MASTERLLPDIAQLHERHYGLTPSVCGTYAEAAATHLDDVASPPARLTYRHVTDGRDATYLINWTSSTRRVRVAWANDIDTTEAGAYGIALALVEVDLGLTALSRVQQGGGADYWIGPAGSAINAEDGELDLQDARRLEVSGIEACESEAALLHRLGRKVDQVQRGGDDGGIAAVVAFNMLRAAVRVV